MRLQQVVGNLVNNAAKYAGVGGSIDVRVVLDEDDVVLSVRDDGPGVPPDKLEAIFELFVQANPTLGRSEGGLGIGLTLVKRVVDLHGGTVLARNNAAGRGAESSSAAGRPGDSAIRCVRIQVPWFTALLVSRPSRRKEYVWPFCGVGTRSLLPPVRGVLRHAAIRWTSSSGIVARLDGYEVARRVRHAHGDGICLVALTGYGQPRDRERSESAGFDAHLVKPIEPRKLVETLDGLARHRAR